MITKFKIFETHSDVDPLGEEIWNEDELFMNFKKQLELKKKNT
jgi:hypothetical protein